MKMIGYGLWMERSAFLQALVSSSVLLPQRTQLQLLQPSSLSSYWEMVTDDGSRRKNSASHNPTDSPPWRQWADLVRAETDSYLDHRVPSMAGPLVRLAFHDAATLERRRSSTGRKTSDSNMTGGPNGSIRNELERFENRALSRPLNVVLDIYEKSLSTLSTTWQPRTSSSLSSLTLADTIALTAAQAIEHTGGPHISIRLGRPDNGHDSDVEFLQTPLITKKGGTERSRVTKTLPQANLDSDGLRLYFGRKHLGLSTAEFVALSGAHGMGRHVSLLGMDKTCLKNLTRSCLEDAPVLLPFVTSSVDQFTNDYFTALLQWSNRQVKLGDVAFIPTDVALVVDKDLRRYVKLFARDQNIYFKVFRRAFQKLVDSTATSRQSY